VQTHSPPACVHVYATLRNAWPRIRRTACPVTYSRAFGRNPFHNVDESPARGALLAGLFFRDRLNARFHSTTRRLISSFSSRIVLRRHSKLEKFDARENSARMFLRDRCIYSFISFIWFCFIRNSARLSERLVNRFLCFRYRKTNAAYDDFYRRIMNLFQVFRKIPRKSVLLPTCFQRKIP